MDEERDHATGGDIQKRNGAELKVLAFFHLAVSLALREVVAAHRQDEHVDNKRHTNENP